MHQLICTEVCATCTCTCWHCSPCFVPSYTAPAVANNVLSLKTDVDRLQSLRTGGLSRQWYLNKATLHANILSEKIYRFAKKIIICRQSTTATVCCTVDRPKRTNAACVFPGYLRPLLIRSDDGSSKVWICLLTCLSTRVVHLEVVVGLSIDAFLNGLTVYGSPWLTSHDNM